MRRTDLDPVDLGRLLPNVMLVEVGDGGIESMRFRLAGAEIEGRYNRSLKGLSVVETFALKPRAATANQWVEILADRRPKYRLGPLQFADGQRFHHERLLLPLADAGRVSHILGAIFFAQPDGQQPREIVSYTITE